MHFLFVKSHQKVIIAQTNLGKKRGCSKDDAPKQRALTTYCGGK
jgi:hypothetical protein